jgi:seryl-tRNA synthetase
VIDVRLLRANPTEVRAALARRGDLELDALVARAQDVDGRLREITARRDEIRARVNEVSREVGRLRREGDIAAAEALQGESRELGSEEAELAAEHDALAAALRELLLVIPNIPSDEVPDGASDADNPVVSGPFLPEGGEGGFAEHQRVPHWEIGADLGILDNERAAKIAASMFTMQRGAGATLSRALCQYALDSNADAFEEVRPPTLVSTATLTSTGQLPKFADDAYFIERDDLWCIPTAEVPLTSIHAG